MRSPTHTLPHAPVVAEDGRFTVALDGHEFARGVRLLQEVRRPRDEPRLRRVRGGWRTTFHPGPVDRLEYRFAVTHADGGTEVVTDPHAADRVANPFGDRSVWTRESYRAPTWLDATPARHGARWSAELPVPSLGGPLTVRGWAHPDLPAGRPAPLLLVHDGPAYDDEAALGRLLDHLVDDRRVPPFRAAMLAVADRDAHYSADPAYARALVDVVLPWLATADPTTGPTSTVIGLGSSLGALAHLHAAVRHPGTYGGLLLQSGSYFRPGLDRVESSFPWFGRVTDLTDELCTHGPGPIAVPTVVTCGLVEENLANNEVVADVLRAAAWPVRSVWHRDAHNMTSWRDALDPGLRDLLIAVAGRA